MAQKKDENEEKTGLIATSIEYYKRHKELLNYFIVGVIGTIISIASFAIVMKLCDNDIAANIASWIISVTVLYMLNRYYVFDNHAHGAKGVFFEIIKFASARLLTLLLETLIIFLGHDQMHFDAVIVKTIAQVVVIVLNYVASKLIIFKK